MRYAPTLVRLKSWVYWIGGGFRFRSLQGVCDTPLHMFGDFMGIMMVVGHATSPTSGRTTKTATLVGDGDGG